MVGVSAHGYLQEPPARNVRSDCAQCLNAGGTWTVFRDGVPGKYGVCGDSRDGPFTYETPGPVVRTYRRGSTLKARVVLTANHKGRFALKLCPSTDVSQSCFDAHALRTTRGKKYTTVREGKDSYAVTYRLPRDVRCKRCVLQWTYETANSCNLRGSPPIVGIPECHESPNWERFWNCADIKVV